MEWCNMYVCTVHLMQEYPISSLVRMLLRFDFQFCTNLAQMLYIVDRSMDSGWLACFVLKARLVDHLRVHCTLPYESQSISEHWQSAVPCVRLTWKLKCTYWLYCEIQMIREIFHMSGILGMVDRYQKDKNVYLKNNIIIVNVLDLQKNSTNICIIFLRWPFH